MKGESGVGLNKRLATSSGFVAVFNGFTRLQLITFELILILWLVVHPFSCFTLQALSVESFLAALY